MRYPRFAEVVLAALFATLAGCANKPHNNVLLFGTDTKLAIDVSTEATQGGMPEITIGYKRREGVWMPLAKNVIQCTGDTSETVECVVTGTGENYEGQAEGISQLKGGKELEKDAYSVFASFGATFESGADATQGNAAASGGLAQFFATGIAAQRLGANPRVADVLSVKSADAQDAANARAVASVAMDEAAQAAAELESTKAQIRHSIGQEAYDKAMATGVTQSTKAQSEIELLVMCARPGDPDGSADAMIADASTIPQIQPSVKARLAFLKRKDEKNWRTQLQASDESRRALMSVYSKNC